MVSEARHLADEVAVGLGRAVAVLAVIVVLVVLVRNVVHHVLRGGADVTNVPEQKYLIFPFNKTTWRDLIS
jgi:hypothetical protein